MTDKDLADKIKPYANLREENLWGADLWEANLWGADLRGANLWGADLRKANLRKASLRGASLRGADLVEASLRGASLRGADLVEADLREADLREADLREADLRGAKNIPDYVFAVTSIVPETGAFDGWKSCKGRVLVRLRIPAKARRSNATGRKCRAEFVKVLDVIGAEVGHNKTHTQKPTEYRKGETVHCHEWDDDRWNECGGGIHFFLTRYEAEQW